MKRVLTILLVGALVLSTIPAVVYAASGGVSGQAKGGNTAPTIEEVLLVEQADDTVVTAMTPLSTYRIKVTAGDINTVNDIEYIIFKVYHTSAGANWDADAIFMWDKDGGAGLADRFTVENGAAATTWEVVAIDCDEPASYAGTTGVWYLDFKPGKLAQADAVAKWFVSATAYDENKSGTGAWVAGSTMGAYAAVAFDTATITLGDATAGIEPGATGYITTPPSNNVTVKITTNKQYALGVQTEATWDDGGSNTITLDPAGPGDLGSEEFALGIDNEQLGDPGEPKTPLPVTASNATITGFSVQTRVTTGVNASEGTNDAPMYMALTFAAAGIQEVTYSGDITFTVTN